MDDIKYDTKIGEYGYKIGEDHKSHVQRFIA